MLDARPDRFRGARCENIMDHLRILLVPFHATSLMLVGVLAVLLAFFGSAGVYGLFGQLFLQIWVLKYCYVVLEHIADGAQEPPVMSTDMLSPFEVRPWIQLGIVIGGAMLCKALGGTPSLVLAYALLALLPASIAVLGMGEAFYQAVNPLILFRLIRGIGPYYLLVLASIPVYLGLLYFVDWLGSWKVFWHATALLCELSFFSLIGGCIYLRRRQLGYEPSRSPERSAARLEGEREKLRARMVDEVFEQVRVGKHVEATRPLARWLATLDGETATRDARHVAGQALGWGNPAALNSIASTLIRHLLRAGRPDTALFVFERLREQSAALTLDSADDLRTLIDYAESCGREELATSMRLETPIYRP